MRTTLHRLPLMALLLTTALAWTPMAAIAQDTVIFQDVPTVDELNAVLFGKPADPAAPPIKTRAIRFHGAAAASPPPASVPAQVPAQAAPPAEAAVASTEPMAPAPPPPAGTALGMNILFEYNSTNVLPDSLPYLERLGEVLNLPENQGKVINIIGHTDATGSSAYNQGLSEQRALAVGQYLVDVWQISPERLGVEGRGENQPLAGTDPNDGVNRRVEFYALE
ncbi:MAG: OmpA family protein [Geminicoccaceae bacterium]|nr:OmpA family protein [Geminicoccaceae bacterium]